MLAPDAPRADAFAHPDAPNLDAPIPDAVPADAGPALACLGHAASTTATDPVAVTATVSIQTSYTNAPRYVKLLLNSGSGSITATVVQYNVVTR